MWIRVDVPRHRHAGTGEPRHFIPQIQDITERQHAETQLFQAKVEAETPKAVKNEFLLRMSHDDPAVFVVSAGTRGEQIERTCGLGPQACIIKPVNIDELRRTIEEAIHTAAAR